MTLSANLLENNVLSALAARAGGVVTGAIHKASTVTGVDFAYLLEQAAAESDFDPAAKAGTSSATGLYQFIESTWMSMVKEHGHKYGIDADMKKSDLLALREDPQKSAFMAAELAADNKRYLQQHVGGDIGATEMYFAHFMGAGGAAAFLKERAHNPMAVAADIFPHEATANRGVFYDQKTGQPRTLEQVYAFFDKKFSGADGMAAEQAPVPPRKPDAVKTDTSAAGSLFAGAEIFNSVWPASSSESPVETSLFSAMTGRNTQIFPSSLYSRMVLSPSELMLLSAMDI